MYTETIVDYNITQARTKNLAAVLTTKLIWVTIKESLNVPVKSCPKGWGPEGPISMEKYLSWAGLWGQYRGDGGKDIFMADHSTQRVSITV